MIFKNFRFNIIFRLLLLSSFILISYWGYEHTAWQATPLVSGLLAILVAVDLIRYVESINRELSGFLDFVAHQDFAVSFPIGNKGKVFNQLELAYKVLSSTYQNLNVQKAANHQYLAALVEHVSIAVVCLNHAGEVRLMNQQAKKLFKAPHLQSLHSFKRIDPKLPALIADLANGDRTLVELNMEGEPLYVTLYVTEFELLDEQYKLISFQNIRDELEQREIDFSQKLIRVLTHEIMNSVTPIISLTSVIQDTLRHPETGALSFAHLAPGDQADLQASLAAMTSRSKGLLKFVQTYSHLSNLPKPVMAETDVTALLQGVVALMSAIAAEKSIELTMRSAPGLHIQADAQQIEQVLINLIKNAIEALAEHSGERTIHLIGEAKPGNGTIMRVIDNGPGIAQDQLDKIFVPFYSTKRNGSGVGLSVSRQIMFRNKGYIGVKSLPSAGCEFTLHFK